MTTTDSITQEAYVGWREKRSILGPKTCIFIIIYSHLTLGPLPGCVLDYQPVKDPGTGNTDNSSDEETSSTNDTHGYFDTDAPNGSELTDEDECPNDPSKIHPGPCGCGIPDVDSDGDGTPDCNDECPSDPNKTTPGICGCGTADCNYPPKIVPPTIPADGATAVPTSSNLVATFNEPVKLSSGGAVTLRNLTMGSDFDRVMTLPNGQVSVSGAQLTINPTVDLDFNTDYAVQISADAIEDLDGNPFAGILGDDAWNFSTPVSQAGIEVTPDHIVSGEVNGKLLAIDVPYVATIPATGGPDWPGIADDGFTTVNSALSEEDDGTSPWEPDGTPLSEAKAYRASYGDNPSVKYVFDLPDGTLINAVYTTWNHRSKDGCTYSYTEGTTSDSAPITQDAEPFGNLVLSWTDKVGVVREGIFQRLFIGPITVEGGNGFELWAWDNLGNAANVDAVVLDLSPSSQ